MTPFEYKGYIGSVEYSDDATILYGKIENIKSLVTYESENIAGLKKEFIDSIETYLDFCERKGVTPEKPMSGKVTLRMTPDLHKQVYVAAQGRRKLEQLY